MGGQGVAESSGPWVRPTSLLMVGFQALSPACELGAETSSGGVSLKSQSPPGVATFCGRGMKEVVRVQGDLAEGECRPG